MKVIKYIPETDDAKQNSGDCLLNSVSEAQGAKFSVSSKGTFKSIGLNTQVRAGDGSTMKVSIPEETLTTIVIECTVMKRHKTPISCPDIYVTKGNGTTKTSVKVTEGAVSSIGLFDVKEFTLTFPLKSPKEKSAVIHFGKDTNIIRSITVTII